MEVHLVTVKAFDSEFDANLAIAKLSQYGIPAFTMMNNDVILQPVTSASRTVDVKVEQHFLEEAAGILAQFENVGE